jgi:hypothetical protein
MARVIRGRLNWVSGSTSRSNWFMKRFIGLFAALLLAIPVYAQDDDGPGDGGGGGGGGGGQTQVFTRVDTLDPMDQVKTFLAKANIKLSSDQEKELRPQVEAALKQAQEATERLATPAGTRGGGGGERGQRGGRGGAVGPVANSPLATELRRINDDLVTKINAALKPDQQAVFKKFRNDEIKRAGGFPALKLVMEEAGASLTPEQEQQIQALYTEDARQRVQLMRESQGRPDPAKLDELEKGTMLKVARALNAAQRKALLDSRAPSPAK